MTKEFEKQPYLEIEVLQSKNNSTKKSRLFKALSGVVGIIAVPSLVAANFSDENEENRISAANLEIAPTDTIIDSTTTLLLDETSTTISVDTTTVDTTNLDTTSSVAINPENPTNPDITLTPDTTIEATTTTPETTIPPLEGLNVSFFENDVDNLIYPGDIVTYKINFENADNVVKEVNILATFNSNSGSVFSQIIDLRINGCSQYIDNSGPLHLDITSIVMQPNQQCSIEYDAYVSFTNGSVISYVQLDDITADRRYFFGSNKLES